MKSIFKFLRFFCHMFCNWQHVDYRYELINDLLINNSIQFFCLVSEFQQLSWHALLCHSQFWQQKHKRDRAKRKIWQLRFLSSSSYFHEVLTKSWTFPSFLALCPFFFIAFFACLRALFFFQTLKFVLQTRDFLI